MNDGAAPSDRWKLAELCIELSGPTAERTRWRTLLGALPRAEESRCSLRIFSHVHATAVRAALDDLQPWHFHGQVQCSRSANAVRVDDGESWVDLCDDATTLHAYLSERPAIDARALGDVTARVALSVALRNARRFELHAGMVALDDAHALLIVGESGAGKSTLTTAFASAGARVACDDTALLFDRNGAPAVAALPRPFFLGPAALDAFPSLRAHARHADLHGDKWSLDAGSALGALITTPFVAARLFLPSIDRGSATTSIEPVSQAEALGELIAASAVMLVEGVPHRDEQLRILQTIARRTPAHRVRLGADLLQAPHDVARRLLAPIVPPTSPSRERTET